MTYKNFPIFNDDWEFQDYVTRCSHLSPREKLQVMEEMRDFYTQKRGITPEKDRNELERQASMSKD